MFSLFKRRHLKMWGTGKISLFFVSYLLRTENVFPFQASAPKNVRHWKYFSFFLCATFAELKMFSLFKRRHLKMWGTGKIFPFLVSHLPRTENVFPFQASVPKNMRHWKYFSFFLWATFQKLKMFLVFKCRHQDKNLIVNFLVNSFSTASNATTRSN